MRCSYCGYTTFDNAQVCKSCGKTLAPQAVTSTGVEAETVVSNLLSRPRAGFWVRLLAYIIDSIVLAVAGGILSFATGLGVGIGAIITGSMDESTEMITGIFGLIINITLSLIYYVAFVGARGQTPGKMALGLKIIRTSGEEMTYGRAFLRWIGYWASFLTIGIGFLMIAFSREKQGLHDKIAGTYVVRLKD